MPNPQENEAVVWDAIDWKGIEAEEEHHRREQEAHTCAEAEKQKASGTQPTATEIERAKLESERQTLQKERQEIEAERKRLADGEAARKAEDARRIESERIERERREEAERNQREKEEKSRREEELRLQRAREDQARRDEEASRRKAEEGKAREAEETERVRAREQRVTATNQNTPPPSPGASSTAPWGGTANAPETESETRPRQWPPPRLHGEAGNAPVVEPEKPRKSRGLPGLAFQPTIIQPPAPAEKSSTPTPIATQVAASKASQPFPQEEQPPISPPAPNPVKKSTILGPAFGGTKTEDTDKKRAD